MKTTTVDVNVPLQESEYAEKGRKIANLYREYGGVESAKRASMSNYKAKLEKLDEDIAELANQIKDGTKKETRSAYRRISDDGTCHNYYDIFTLELLKTVKIEKSEDEKPEQNLFDQENPEKVQEKQDRLQNLIQILSEINDPEAFMDWYRSFEIQSHEELDYIIDKAEVMGLAQPIAQSEEQSSQPEILNESNGDEELDETEEAEDTEPDDSEDDDSDENIEEDTGL